MNDYGKGVVIALGPEEGASFWQPLPSTGYVINKINPYNSPYDTFSTGLQVLEPGAHIRRHAHERNHELLFCYQGTGTAEIDGKFYELRPETMILVGRGLQHKVQHRKRSDAAALAHRPGRSGGLVPRHRPAAPGGRTAAGPVRPAGGCRSGPGAATVRWVTRRRRLKARSSISLRGDVDSRLGNKT